MKLSEEQKANSLSPVTNPRKETFTSSPLPVVHVKDGNGGEHVAMSFVLPPKYLGWKYKLNKKKLTPPPSGILPWYLAPLPKKPYSKRIKLESWLRKHGY